MFVLGPVRPGWVVAVAALRPEPGAYPLVSGILCCSQA